MTSWSSSLNWTPTSCPAWRDWTRRSSVSAPYAAALQVANMSDMAFLPILAATMTSSCLQDLPAATALAVAMVIGLVALIRYSGPAGVLGGSGPSKLLISCAMASMVDSKALVPLVCSSSTDLTVLRRLVTLVTISLAESFRVCMAGWWLFFPLADLVACIRSPRALVTSLTALISMTWASWFWEPRLAAPFFTTSDRVTMVDTAFCAATASCSCEDAAPATRVLVSSTRALAVFRMFSL